MYALEKIEGYKTGNREVQNIKDNNLKGKLYLDFQIRRGRTGLNRCIQKPPLKASNMLYFDSSNFATIYLMETSGGILAGDENEITLNLGENTKVNLIQQSATKIYPSENGKESVQNHRIRIGSNASLNYKPEAVIPYENSKYNSTTEIEMTKDSSLFWGEIIAPGRVRKGETFQYKSFNNVFTIKRDKKLIVYDKIKLIPSKINLHSPLIFNYYLYLASCYYISEEIKKKDINLKEIVDNNLITVPDEIETGITMLDQGVFLVRMLANDLCLLKKQLKIIENIFLTTELTGFWK